jgi:O-antigen/teichoic acid export membrane protein
VALAGKAAEAVTLVALVTVVPRALGPAAYGTLALLSTLVTLGSLALSLGGPTLLSRFVPAAAPSERAGLALAIAARLARTRALGLAAIAAGGALALALAPGRLDAPAALLVLAAIAVDTAATLLAQVALALGRTTQWSLRYPVQTAVLVVLAAALGDTAVGAALALLAASAVALVVGIAVTVPHLAGVPRARALPAGAARFGVVAALAGLAVHLLQRLPVPLTALLDGRASETGFAGIALGVGLAGIYTVGQLAAVRLPALVASREAEAEARRHARRMLAVAAPASLAGAVLAPLVVPALAGPGFEEGAEALAPALAAVPLAVPIAHQAHVAALRLRPQRRLAAVAAGLAVSVAAAAALVPAVGAAGALGALLAGSAVAALAGAVLLPGARDPLVLGGALATAAAALALGLAVGA